MCIEAAYERWVVQDPSHGPALPGASARARRDAVAARRIRTRSSARSSCPAARSSAKAGTSGRAARTQRSSRSRRPARRREGATVYVTLEPCAHHGATPPCVDALVEAGVGASSPGRSTRIRSTAVVSSVLRQAGVETELADGELAFRCRQQIEEWRTWVSAGRPFVTYKVAITLDGRVRVPGTRWVTGEASRTLVHVLRAQSDAVAVGMGTVRWDNPRLDARDVPVVRAAAPARVRPRAASRRLGARAALWPARGGARALSRTRACSRSSSKAARRSPRRSSRRPRRQAARLRRSEDLGRRPRDARRAAASARAHAHGGAPDRRRRAPPGVPPRAVVTVQPCSRESFASSGSSSEQRRHSGGRTLVVRAPEAASRVACRAARSRSTAAASRRPRSQPARSPSTRFRRRSRERPWEISTWTTGSTSSRRSARARSSAGTTCRGTSTPSVVIQSVEAEGEGLRVFVEAPDDDPALLRREGLDHRRRRLADRGGARGRRVRRRARSAHARGHDALRHCGRASA